MGHRLTAQTTSTGGSGFRGQQPQGKSVWAGCFWTSRAETSSRGDGFPSKWGSVLLALLTNNRFQECCLLGMGLEEQSWWVM